MNLTLVIAISTSATTSATTSAPNTIASPSTADDSYNVSHAISAFSVIVKPAFTKYLEETRANLIKRVTQPKYDDLVSWLADLNCIAHSQVERNAKSKAKQRWYIREDVPPELRGLWRRPTGPNKRALKVVPEPDIYDIIVRKHSDVKHSGQKKTYRIIATEYYGIRSIEVKWLLKHCRICKE